MNLEAYIFLTDNSLLKVENILWEGQPQRGPYIFVAIGHLIGSIMVAILCWYIFVAISWWTGTELDWWTMKAMVITLTSFGLFTMIKKLLELRHIKYLVTPTEILIRYGALFKGERIIKKASIKSAEIHKNLIEKYFGVATIMIDLGEVDKIEGGKIIHRIESLTDPNLVLMYIQRNNYS